MMGPPKGLYSLVLYLPPVRTGGALRDKDRSIQGPNPNFHTIHKMRASPTLTLRLTGLAGHQGIFKPCVLYSLIP